MPEYYTGNFYLSQSQMEVNATWIYNYLSTCSNPWTIEAISGMLGNAQTESTINPGIWQGLKENFGPGYGLTQWTPYAKYWDWCQSEGLEPSNIESACKRLILESESGGLQWVTHSNYPLTFEQYIKSTATPYHLGMTFLNNYEMPAQINQPIRGTQAENWYTFLSGGQPPTPPTPPEGEDRNVYTRGKSILIPLLRGARREKLNGKIKQGRT